MKTENLSALQIHKLSKQQYQRIIEGNLYDENALYLTPDSDGVYTIYVMFSANTHQPMTVNFNRAEVRAAIENNQTIMCDYIYEDDDGIFSIVGSFDNHKMLLLFK